MNKKSLSKLATVLSIATLITSGSAAVSQTAALWDDLFTVAPQDSNVNVQELINSSFVNAVDYYGNTPLMCTPSKDIAETILSFAQKIGKLKEVLAAKDFDDKTALMKKIQDRYTDVTDLIIKYATENKLLNDVLLAKDNNNKSVLMYYAGTNYTNGLDTVISYTKEINKVKTVLNQVDNNGYTALMYAISGNYTGAAQKLIEAGADVNLTGTKDGTNALSIATKNNNSDIFKLLIKNKANINLEVNDKQRAVYKGSWETLRCAITNKNFDIISFILENDSSKEKFTKEFIEKIKNKDEKALETLKCHCDFALLPPPPARANA